MKLQQESVKVTSINIIHVLAMDIIVIFIPLEYANASPIEQSTHVHKHGWEERLFLDELILTAEQRGNGNANEWCLMTQRNLLDHGRSQDKEASK